MKKYALYHIDDKKIPKDVIKKKGQKEAVKVVQGYLGQHSDMAPSIVNSSLSYLSGNAMLASGVGFFAENLFGS